MSLVATKSTVILVIKNKEKILEASDIASFKPIRKGFRLAAHSGIEEALLIWFKQAQTMNLPISGPNSWSVSRLDM